MKLSLRPLLILSVAAAVGGACTYGHQDSQTSVFRPLVFPGEARLGASAFMVIDSNDILIGDHLERYDLHRDRVEILVEGNQDTVPATLRSVFAVEAAGATPQAEANPNWSMVAFFDLPDETQGAFLPPYPVHAPLHLKVDGVLVPELEGVIWIVGEGGSPTSMDAMPLLPLLEDELEPQTMVRLRARGSDGSGFDPSWVVGGLRADVHYDPDCLANPRAHAGSNASRAGVTVGPSLDAPSGFPAGLKSAQLLLTYPRGFSLPVAGAIDPTRLGSGPILDIAFDRIDDPVNCSGGLDQYFWVRGLEVWEPDGVLRADRPYPSEQTSFDAAEFFHFHYVDPDPPS